MIEIKNLTKKFGDFVAVDNLTLNIESKKIFALLGVNGAGKSTTIKMLSCLLAPTSGTALLANLDLIKDQSKIKHIINVSPQETAVAQNLTVEQNLLFIAKIYDISKDNLQKDVSEMLRQCNLEEVKNKRGKLLSGG